MRLEEAVQVEVAHGSGHLNGWKTGVKALAVLGVIALASALIYAWLSEIDLRSLEALGYPGVFLLSFLAAATVLVPVPGLLATIGAGAFLNPAAIGLVAGLGAASGELVGYAAGRAGRATIKSHMGQKWHKAEFYLGRFGFWAILALAVVPNPFFDAIGLVAGALAYPVARFWIAAAIGNCVKYMAMAYLGGVITVALNLG